jgi:hypothetical protein
MYFSPYLVLIPIGFAVILSIGVFGGGAILDSKYPDMSRGAPTGMNAYQPDSYRGGSRKTRRHRNKSKRVRSNKG